MKKTGLFILLIFTMILAACGGGPEPTAEPTEVPADTPVPAAFELNTVPVDEITNITWQWEATVEELPASQSVVPNPENYTLVFLSDGTIQAKADCNMAGGGYSVEGDKLTFTPGPMTLAECGPDSLYNMYLLQLGETGSFGMRDDDLYLVSQDGNARMQFANAGPAPEMVSAPEPEPTDPLAILGTPDGLETFDNKRNWGTFDNQCFQSNITAGQFVMTAKGQENTYCWEITWPQIDNFFIETLVNMPEACDPQDRFGMLLRAPDNNRGYLYGLDCAGNYSLMLYDGRQTSVLVEPAQSDAIVRDAGESNRLGIALSGGNFYLYANGKYLDEVENFTYTAPGKLGYFVRAATTSPFTVTYDELAIWALDDTFYPPQRTSPPRFPEISLPPPPESAARGTAKVNVNIRTGPGMQFKVIGAALQGQSGEVLGVSPDGYWYNVALPSGLTAYDTGWVAKDYVNLSPSDAVLPVITPPFLPQTIVVEPPAKNAPQVFTLERANVRIGPGIEYPMIGLTSVNVSAEVTGKVESGEWWQIKLPASSVEGGVGWVNSISVETKNVSNVAVIPASDLPPVPPDARPTAPGQGAAAAKALETISVYSSPDTGSASYGKAPAGAIMAITGKTEDGKWWRINLPTEIASSGFGWVEAGFVQTSKTDNVPVIQNP